MFKTPNKKLKPIPINSLTPNTSRDKDKTILPSLNLNAIANSSNNFSNTSNYSPAKKNNLAVSSNDIFKDNKDPKDIKKAHHNKSSSFSPLSFQGIGNLSNKNSNHNLNSNNITSTMNSIFNKLNGINSNSKNTAVSIKSIFEKNDAHSLYDNSPLLNRDKGIGSKTNKHKTKEDFDLEQQLDNFELNPQPLPEYSDTAREEKNSLRPIELKTANSKKGKSKSQVYGDQADCIMQDKIERKTSSSKSCLISSVSYKTQAGKVSAFQSKTNQDSFMILTNILNIKAFNIFGVFDGHGTQGHLISDYLKTYFTSFFSNKEIYMSDNNDINEQSIYERLTEKNYDIICYAFNLCESSLSKTKLDPNLSGSTCVIVFCISDKIICANAGDSRAILSTKNGIKVLSFDHKPDNKEEKERIIKSGGKVHPIREFGRFVGPARVWVKSGEYPGLAMSRSIGDFVAKSVGCTCSPGKYNINILNKKRLLKQG